MNIGDLQPKETYRTTWAKVGIDWGRYYIEYIRTKYFTVLDIYLLSINYAVFYNIHKNSTIEFNLIHCI
jgi:hypothetical protein